MQAFVSLVFRVAYAPLLRICTASLQPVFASLALEPAQILSLVDKVSAKLRGTAVTYEVMGIYSALQQQEIVEGVADGVSAILASFSITQSNADIGRLLGDVARNLSTPA